MPVLLHLEQCTACGLCVDACPSPIAFSWSPALLPSARRRFPSGQRRFLMSGFRCRPVSPLVVKGTYAAAVGAVLAGCRHVFGYPITPSTEGAELMAKVQPALDGVFVQAVSEVATVNMMYGAAGPGSGA